MITLGIDPGVHHQALVFLEGNQVIGQFYVPTESLGHELPSILASLPAPATVVVEGQVHYAHDRRSIPNDLIALAYAAGRIEGLLRALLDDTTRFLSPKPQEWKGTVPKSIHQARIQGKVKGTLQNGHLVDAAGLALWGFNRK